MTRGPRRLKDDPDFQWETGCDLSDEARLVGGYDLGASRSRLLAAIALLPPAGPDPLSPTEVGDGVPSVRPGSSGWMRLLRPVIGAVTGTIVVAAAYWLGVRAGTEEAPEPIEISAPREEALRTPPEIRDPQPPSDTPAPEALPESTLREGAPSTSPGSRTRPPVVSAPPLEAAPQAGGSERAPSGPGDPGGERAPGAADPEEDPRGAPPSPPSSRLRAEQEALAPADQALDAGRFEEARRGYESYLARFPGGTIVVEAEWGLLKSLRGVGDAAATEALAENIQDLPEFSSRRQDILRLRAEALVHLGRCDDALLVVEELSSRSTADIRRACRQTSRGGP